LASTTTDKLFHTFTILVKHFAICARQGCFFVPAAKPKNSGDILLHSVKKPEASYKPEHHMIHNHLPVTYGMHLHNDADLQ